MPADRDYRSHRPSIYDEAARYRKERNLYQTQCAELSAIISSREDRQHKLEEEARNNESRARRKEKQVAQLEEELKNLQERERDRYNQLRTARQELAVTELQYKETNRLLKMKVDELDGMQAFTRRADQISVADVIDLVRALNAKTLQVAALISDPQHFPSSQDQASDQDMSKAIDAVKNNLGEEIAEAVRSLRDLRKERHPEDPTAVQLTLQIVLTGFCKTMINTWTPDRPSDTNEWLISMYEKIRTTESQTVAGRWRALTRAQMGVKDPNFILELLMDQLAEVLTGVGCLVQAHKLRETFQKQLTGIVDQIVRIQKAVGESVTSMDVMPYSCPPGVNFRTDFMDDMYGSGVVEDVGEDAIVGTTELGLWKKEKTDTTGPLESQYLPLLKAKVVLGSALQE